MDDPLVEGFFRYRKQYFVDEPDLYKLLNKGQNPSALVIGCCDSRVHPPALLGTQPGELFVVRNVANLVPPYQTENHHASVSAALEFAVLGLGVQRIIVLGHNNCGGIRALVNQNAPKGSALDQWLSIAQTAREAAQAQLQQFPEKNHYELCEHMAIRISLQNLRSYPFLSDIITQGNLQIEGWYFDMQAGRMLRYEPEQEQFVAVTTVQETETI